jgi:hypothetical protein
MPGELNMTEAPLRIAMWSGPRNISTAMMRSFENRSDTAVFDEPFYAAYLHSTGITHPMNEAILASQSIDWRAVREQILDQVPENKPVYYQKHMTHHLLDEIDREWIGQFFNAFLIRNPRAIVASYSAKRAEVGLGDIGIIEQAEIFDYVCQLTGKTPPVLEANDVLQNPRSVLGQFCELVGIDFSESMLSWPTGRRDTDGIWAEHWYGAVENSTGFSQPKPDLSPLEDQRLEALAEQSMDSYRRMAQHRISP